jgi:hypothetical protein
MTLPSRLQTASVSNLERVSYLGKTMLTRTTSICKRRYLTSQHLDQAVQRIYLKVTSIKMLEEVLDQESVEVELIYPN